MNELGVMRQFRDSLPMPKHWSPISVVILTVALLLLSVIALKFMPAPFAWTSLAWAFALLVLTVNLKAKRTRVVIFNLAVLTALFSVAEVYVAFHERPRPTVSDGSFVPDDVLGTVPAKETRAHSKESRHGKVLYDVTYTIAANGLRIAPPTNTARLDGSVLFFGDSFTYGEGVQDDESMPYQVGMQSGGHYRIYNFGFHGYGPNQMLAAVESGRVRQVVDMPPRYAIY
jgi:hypothetical protein